MDKSSSLKTASQNVGRWYSTWLSSGIVLDFRGFQKYHFANYSEILFDLTSASFRGNLLDDSYFYPRSICFQLKAMPYDMELAIILKENHQYYQGQAGKGGPPCFN